MKALKTGLVITLAVIFSIACGTTNEPANKNAAPAAKASPSKPPIESAPATNSTPPEKLEGGNSSLGAPKGEMQPTASTDTAKIFSDKCALCHGADGKGVTKGTPDFTNAEWQKKETDAEFAKKIKDGKKPMPAFGNKLSEEQINALVQYVRTFAKK